VRYNSRTHRWDKYKGLQ